MLKCPIHELPGNIVIDNFYVRLTLHEKEFLDASCFGSFTHMKEDAKWKLLDRIQENVEGWENDKGRKSGINYDYECIKAFRDFYFCALGSLVVLSFPQLLSFSSFLSKPLSETLTSAGTAGCPTGQQL
jgi:hypothetical protein